MDLVLLIIVLVFIFDNQKHNYAVLIILSLLGLILTIALGIFISPLFFIDTGLYALTLIMSCCGDDKK